MSWGWCRGGRCEQRPFTALLSVGPRARGGIVRRLRRHRRRRRRRCRRRCRRCRGGWDEGGREGDGTERGRE
jgi:hypothetical protein